MLVVQKFGGSSVANNTRVRNVAKRILETKLSGAKVIVVLSAQGDTTDELIQKAHELNKNASKRELDMLLATGEQQSVALMAIALQSLGVPSISLNAWQIGMKSTDSYSNARILDIKNERIFKELDEGKVVIITGFQGCNKYDDITTLGRGGSDTTAVAVAAAVNADVCEIYTDVDGVYTGDPRIIKDATKIEQIGYEEMLTLASLGAKVLHSRSVELAQKFNVNLSVCSSFTKDKGTIVKEDSGLEKAIISGVAVDKNIAQITIKGIKNYVNKLLVFDILSNYNISLDTAIQNEDKNGINFICTINIDDYEMAIKILEENKGKIGYEEMSSSVDLAKLSIVGSAMVNQAGVGLTFYNIIQENGVDINLISASEIKITALVDKNKVDEIANKVHKAFFEMEKI